MVDPSGPITQDELCNLKKLRALLQNPDNLTALVVSLETVIERGNGEVRIVCKQGKPVFMGTEITQSLSR